MVNPFKKHLTNFQCYIISPLLPAMSSSRSLKRHELVSAQCCVSYSSFLYETNTGPKWVKICFERLFVLLLRKTVITILKENKLQVNYFKQRNLFFTSNWPSASLTSRLLRCTSKPSPITLRAQNLLPKARGRTIQPKRMKLDLWMCY